jgi:hypothetical protein
MELIFVMELEVQTSQHNKGSSVGENRFTKRKQFGWLRLAFSENQQLACLTPSILTETQSHYNTLLAVFANFIAKILNPPSEMRLATTQVSES